MDAFGIALIAVAMLAGLVGTLLPVIPGLPIVWGAALVYGLAAGFEGIGTVAFSLITVVAALGMVAALVLPHRRVAASGVPRSTVVAGLLGGIVGFFVIPVIGLPIGAIAAVMAKETARTSDSSAAWATTKNMIVGFGFGVLLELGAALIVVAIWAGWVLLD